MNQRKMNQFWMKKYKYLCNSINIMNERSSFTKVLHFTGMVKVKLNETYLQWDFAPHYILQELFPLPNRIRWYYTKYHSPNIASHWNHRILFSISILKNKLNWLPFKTKTMYYIRNSSANRLIIIDTRTNAPDSKLLVDRERPWIQENGACASVQIWCHYYYVIDSPSKKCFW